MENRKVIITPGRAMNKTLCTLLLIAWVGAYQGFAKSNGNSSDRYINNTLKHLSIITELSPPTSQNLSGCTGNNMAINVQPGSGGTNVKWYEHAIGGTSFYKGTSLTITNLARDVDYYVSTVNESDNTESTYRGLIHVRVTQTPGKIDEVHGNVIFGPGNFHLVAMENWSPTTYRWYTADDVLVQTGGFLYVTPIINKTTPHYMYTRRVNDQCMGPITWIDLIVYPVATITGPNVIKTNSITLQCNTGFDKYEWYAVNRGLLKSSTENFLLVDTPGTYTLRVTKDGLLHNASPFTVYSKLDGNYVMTNTIQVEGVNSTDAGELSITQNSQSVQYFDGLGRKIQDVETQASPDFNDVVLPTVYNAYGLEERKYLPFTGESGGRYKPTTDIIDSLGNYKGIAQDFYAPGSNNKIADDSRPYHQIVYESSPLNRPVKEVGAGSDWYTNNKYTQYSYLVNTHSTESSATDEKIIAWSIDANGKPVRAVPQSGYVEVGGYFSSGQLSVRVIKDEEGHVTREYMDKDGLIILKKVQVGDNINNLNNVSDWAMTYYVYDKMKRLICVMPPQLSAMLHNNGGIY